MTLCELAACPMVRRNAMRYSGEVTGRPVATHRTLTMEELLDAFLGLHDALAELESTDRFPDLPVEYRRLVCQLRVITGKGIDGIEEA